MKEAFVIIGSIYSCTTSNHLLKNLLMQLTYFFPSRVYIVSSSIMFCVSIIDVWISEDVSYSEHPLGQTKLPALPKLQLIQHNDQKAKIKTSNTTMKKVICVRKIQCWSTCPPSYIGQSNVSFLFSIDCLIRWICWI